MNEYGTIHCSGKLTWAYSGSVSWSGWVVFWGRGRLVWRDCPIFILSSSFLCQCVIVGVLFLYQLLSLLHHKLPGLNSRGLASPEFWRPEVAMPRPRPLSSSWGGQPRPRAAAAALSLCLRRDLPSECLSSVAFSSLCLSLGLFRRTTGMMDQGHHPPSQFNCDLIHIFILVLAVLGLFAATNFSLVR